MVWRPPVQKLKVGRGKSRLKMNWGALVALHAVYLLTLNALASMPPELLAELGLPAGADMGNMEGELSPDSGEMRGEINAGAGASF